MDEKYNFVRFGEIHSDALRKLYLQVNGKVWPESDYKEKFATANIGGAPIGFLAFAPTGELAAYYGVFPVKVEIDGNECIAAQSGNTMTAPAHQGKGLFTKLAKMTYDAAKKEGVAFIFGFPNKNSYPGFVKKLNWQHRVTMNAYNFYVPTFPVSEVIARFSVKLGLYDKYREVALGFFAKKFDPAFGLKTSLNKNGNGTVLRDYNYSVYKRKNLYVLNIVGCSVFFKVDRCIDIGDIHYTSTESLKAALRKIKWIAALLGVVRIRFYVSPDCQTDIALKKITDPSEGLPYGHLALSESYNPDKFYFAFIDYDTF